MLFKKKVTAYVNQTLMFFGHVISMFILDLSLTHDPMQSQNFAALSLKVQLVRPLVPQLGLIFSNVTTDIFIFFNHFRFLEIPFVSFTLLSKFIVELN